MKHFYLFLCSLIVVPSSLLANNLQISSVSATTTSVTFNISWDNSWNINNLSRDAAWVFVKFQDCSSANKSWDHLGLAASGHTVGDPLLQVDPASDGMGVFVRRAGFGGGNNPSTSVTLSFATAFTDISQVNFDVIGIEMVYIPQGSFVIGDGVSNSTFGTNGTNVPNTITSEASIAANGLAYSTALNWDWGNTHPAIPDAFPKGYNAFYCMKYEITQAQYVHFLNLLPAAHQAVRTAVAPGSASKTMAMTSQTIPFTWRNYIQIKTPAAGGPPLNPAVYGMNRDNDNNFDENEDGGNIACNLLSWNDLLAYLDWSALRPMSELEFEKVCRGPSSAGPFPDQIYAWGTVNLSQATNQWDEAGRITNPGQPTEIAVAVGDGLAAYSIDNTVSGPFRVGFAAKTGTSRQQAGATYYGVLEMSGNVAEQCYHIGRTHSETNPGLGPMSLTATFEGTLGDGMLKSDGEANVASWGGATGINYKESIIRGGGFANDWSQLRVSMRYYLHPRMAWNGPQTNNRAHFVGGRGVRQF